MSRKGLIVFGLIAIFNYDVIFLGKSFFARDRWYESTCKSIFSSAFPGKRSTYGTLADPATSAIYNEPIAYLVHQKLVRGELPLWSNQIGLGTHILAKLQPGVLFPLNWLQYLTPSSNGIDLVMVLRIIFCYLSMLFFLLCGLKLKFLPSLVGATVYGFTGHALHRANMNSANIYFIVPLYLYFIQLIHNKNAIKGIIGTGVCVALILLAGFPQAAVGAFLIGGAYHLSLRHWTVLLPMALAYLLGLLLAAPQLLPLFEVLIDLPAGYRSEVGTIGIDVWRLVRFLIFPERPKLEEYPHVLHPGWATALAVILAITGGATALRRRDKSLYIWILLPFLYCIKATNTPIISDVMLWLFKPLSVIYCPRDLSLLLWVPLSILPAYFLNSVGDPKTKGWQIPFTVVFLLTTICGTLHILNEAGEQSIFEYLIQEKTALWMFVFTVLSLISLRLGAKASTYLGILTLLCILFCTPRIDRADKKTFDITTPLPLKEALRTVRPEDKLVHAWANPWCSSHMSAAIGYGALGTVEPLMSDRFFTFMNGLFPCSGAICMLHSGPRIAWDIAGANYFLSVDGSWDPLTAFGKDVKGFDVVWDQDSLKIFNNSNVIPKVFATNHCQIFDHYSQIPAAIKNRAFQPTTAYLDLIGPLPADLNSFCHEKRKLEYQSVRVSTYTDSNIAFDITLPEKSLVVLTENADTSWNATVNGVKTPVIPVFGIYRGLFLEPGKHSVRYAYQPRAFYWGCGLFLFGVFAVVISVAARYFRHRPRPF